MKHVLFSLAVALGIVSSAVADNSFGPLFGPTAFSGDIRFSLEGKTITLGKRKKNVVKTSSTSLVQDALKLQKVVAVAKKPITMPTPKPVPTVPTTFTVNVKRPLDDISARLIPMLEQQLNKESPSFKGFRPYRVSIVRSSTPEMKALVVGNSIQLEYVLRGNKLTSSFRTPDIAFGIGLGSYADPRIEMTVDLTFKATITPQLRALPTVTNISVTPSNAKLRPVNLSSKVLSAINDFVSFVGGPNFVRKAEGMINAQSQASSNPLKGMFNGLNSRIAPLTKDAKALYVRHEGNRISVIYSLKVDQGPIVR
jgi:hypothetical protein